MKTEIVYKTIRDSNPKLCYCERFTEGSEKWDLTRHSHPYIELIFYLEGRASVEVDGYNVEPSIYDTLVYPANCMHLDGVRGERQREIICLWLDIPELVLKQSLLLHERNSTLRDLFQMIYRERKESGNNPYVMEYLLKPLLTNIIRLAESAGNSYGIMREVIPYIHEHFAEKITLEELAKLEHISVSYLSHKFKQYTDMTIVTYLNHVRVEEAKKLLISTDNNIEEIAYQTGYESPKYFCRVFRNMTGQAPSIFRQMYRTKSNNAPF